MTFGAFVTPEMYGARGDGVTDDTVPLRQAFDSRRPVYLPGKYSITETIGVAPPSGAPGPSVTGAGLGSHIYLDAPNITVAFTATDVANPWGFPTQGITLRDFVVVPRSTSSVAAVHMVAPACSGSTMPLFNVQSVHVIPWSPAHYTAAGFWMMNLRNGVFSDCIVAGRYGNIAGTAGGYMLISSAYPPRSNPVDIRFRDCQSAWFSNGFQIEGMGSADPVNNPSDWQGVHLIRPTVLSCWHGLHATSADKFSGHLQVTGGHFNVYKRGIYAPGIWHPEYDKNNFMFSGTESEVIAIDMAADVAQTWPMKGHVRATTVYCARNPAIQHVIGVRAGAVGGGGADTEVTGVSMQKGNAVAATPMHSVGGVVYEAAGNRVTA